MEFLDDLALGFAVALAPTNLLYGFIGTLLVAAGATITAAAGSAFAALGNLPAFSIALLSGVAVMFAGFVRATGSRPSERSDLPAH